MSNALARPVKQADPDDNLIQAETAVPAIVKYVRGLELIQKQGEI
jgi:hypothetical protein